MSGPVDPAGSARDGSFPDPTRGPVCEVSDSRKTVVGGIPVERSLPRHGRRMVGAWCFLDRFGPVDVTPRRTMTVGPHPHIGLHTVTWLLKGEVKHSDSLGNRQVIRPGQLNLMTAGKGIAHAEDSRAQSQGVLNGVQLWIAQPETTRHGPSSFAHHEDLPKVGLGSSEAIVLLGSFEGVRSPAIVDSPLVGVDITASGSLEIELIRAFEYGIAVLAGELTVAGDAVHANQFVYLGTGWDVIRIEAGPATRLLLLGGEPFGTEVLMWWNFVARERAELEVAYADWVSRSERFGEVTSTLERIDAPPPYWAR
jgi:quercetin 2,3-dioxygenase